MARKFYTIQIKWLFSRRIIYILFLKILIFFKNRTWTYKLRHLQNVSWLAFESVTSLDIRTGHRADLEDRRRWSGNGPRCFVDFIPSKMGDSSCRKWCFVPRCESTNTKSPIFLPVPREIRARRQWAKMARREDASTVTSVAPWFCCEDHFNVSISIQAIVD